MGGEQGEDEIEKAEREGCRWSCARGCAEASKQAVVSALGQDGWC